MKLKIIITEKEEFNLSKIKKFHDDACCEVLHCNHIHIPCEDCPFYSVHNKQDLEVALAQVEVEKEPDSNWCSCYYEREVTRHYNDFMQGMIFAKTGKRITENTTTQGYCSGAGPETEECTCGGNKALCNFYPENRKKYSSAKEEEDE